MARLHMICGLPGAGKTALARRLEGDLPGLRLSPDEWIHRVAGEGSELLARANGEQRDASLERANRETREAIEGIQFELALRLVGMGVNVILENGFWTKGEREGLRARASAASVVTTLHYLAVPLDDLWRRLELRNASLPAGTFRITRQQLEEWATLFEPPSATELADRG